MLLLTSKIVNCTAQNLVGKAIFEKKIIFNIENSNNKTSIANDITRMLTHKIEKSFELHFNNNKSIFKEELKLNKPQSFDFLGNSFSEEIIYKNLKHKIYINQKSILDKLFLITDTLKKYNWSIQKESKQILNFNCFKATTKVPTKFNLKSAKDSLPKFNEIEVWFATKIPVNNGPESYHGLPGLILEVKTNYLHYSCTKLTLNPKKKNRN